MIADQDVDATELLVDRTKEGIDVRRPGQVSLENETKLPIFARIGCMLFRIRPLAVLDTDDRAGVRENFGKGRPHVLGYTGNQRYLSIQSHCRSPPLDPSLHSLLG